jgi:trans-L-3-hydroxyproline dehydratase
MGWTAPHDWHRVSTVDAHAEGEPLRVILEGVPQPEGDTMLERRRHARDELDPLRRALMWEPRGHADMYGCLLTPPVTSGADFGVLFLHNEGFSTMCGHGVIAVCTVVLEIGLIPSTEPETALVIDTPAGRVRARATLDSGRVVRVAFQNVPSFAADLDARVHVPGIGGLRYDLSFGGAFYAFVDAETLGLSCTPSHAAELARVGEEIKRAVVDTRPVEHPTEPELGFLYGVIFTGRGTNPGSHSRHVCVFADGEVDRSPTGTGVSARLAILRARGELGPGEPVTIESIVGSRFTGRIVDEVEQGGRTAIVPEVEGRAWITGRHEFWIDPRDELGSGFLLGR